MAVDIYAYILRRLGGIIHEREERIAIYLDMAGRDKETIARVLISYRRTH